MKKSRELIGMMENHFDAELDFIDNVSCVMDYNMEV